MSLEKKNEIRPGRYRHFKGNEYEVIGIANHSETMEEMVVYRALYGEHGLWVRPASMWNETVERDGKVYQRFTYIDEDDETLNKDGEVPYKDHKAPYKDQEVLNNEEDTGPKLHLDVVLEAFESPTNDWTYYYDLENHENLFIFETRFMDDEEERELVEAEPERFIPLPKRREIEADPRLAAFSGEEDPEEKALKMATMWCRIMGLELE